MVRVYIDFSNMSTTMFYYHYIKTNNITNNIIDENDMVISIYIQGDSGMMSCYSIPYAQVYATRVMQIEITADFHITMPFLGTFVGGQTIPLRVETNGVILRPPPPT